MTIAVYSFRSSSSPSLQYTQRELCFLYPAWTLVIRRVSYGIKCRTDHI